MSVYQNISTIAILGAGNMGSAIAHGLVSSGFCKAKEIILTHHQEEHLQIFQKQGFQTTTDNCLAVQKADIIICAVKPQKMKSLLTEIQDVVESEKMIMSIAAGLPLAFFASFFSDNQPLVRVMPNLCARINESMSAWVANNVVTKEQKQIVSSILESFGSALELESEDQMNAVTAISGSGPAYLFYFTELLQKAALNLGLSQEQAQKLIMQTLRGSTLLMEQSSQSPEQLRQAVTSKGGTTQAALDIFYKKDFSSMIQKATMAAAHRAKEIELSKKN